MASPAARRSLFGLANTLRKLGRYAQALEKYERLCGLSRTLKRTGHQPNWCGLARICPMQTGCLSQYRRLSLGTPWLRHGRFGGPAPLPPCGGLAAHG